jgi:hypothetical protein
MITAGLRQAYRNLMEGRKNVGTDIQQDVGMCRPFLKCNVKLPEAKFVSRDRQYSTFQDIVHNRSMYSDFQSKVCIWIVIGYLGVGHFSKNENYANRNMKTETFTQL